MIRSIVKHLLRAPDGQTTPAAPAAEPTPTPAPTPADVAAAHATAMDALAKQIPEAHVAHSMWNEPLPAEPPAAPVVEPAAATPPAAPAPAVTPAPAAEPPAAPAATPTVGDDQIEKIVDKVLARQQPPAQPLPQAPAPAAPAADPLAGLEEGDRENLKIIGLMEQSNPKYAGLAKQTREFWTAEEQWIRAYNAKNPKSPFNAKTPPEEYEEWLAQNEPSYDEADFKRAEREMIRQEAKAEARREAVEATQKEMAPLKVKETMPKIKADAARGVVEMVKAVMPDFAGQMDKGLTEEVSKAIAEKDPIAYRASLEEAEELQAILVQLGAQVELGDRPEAQLTRPIKLPTSERTIIPMQQLAAEVALLEESRLALPADKQRDSKGRQFVTIEQYNQVYDNIVGSALTPEQKQAQWKQFNGQFYMLSPEDIRAGLVENYAKKVSKRVTAWREIAPKPSAAAPVVLAQPTAGTTTTPPAQPVVPQSKPAVVTTASASDAANAGNKPALNEAQSQEQFARSMWS